MLREVAREADDLVHAVDEPLAHVRRRIDCHFAHPADELRLARVAFDLLGERVDPIEREAECLADVADGRAAAIGDHGRGEAGAVAAVFFVDILQHFLAVLVLEIDVDVGGFVPFAADESLEEQIAVSRVDRRHAQTIANGRVRGRAAALGTRCFVSGRIGPNPDGEEVGFVVEVADRARVRA